MAYKKRIVGKFFCPARSSPRRARVFFDPAPLQQDSKPRYKSTGYLLPSLCLKNTSLFRIGFFLTQIRYRKSWLPPIDSCIGMDTHPSGAGSKKTRARRARCFGMLGENTRWGANSIITPASQTSHSKPYPQPLPIQNTNLPATPPQTPKHELQIPADEALSYP